MLFAFAISLLAFAFVIRMFAHIIDRHLFAKDELTKIGTALFLVTFLIFIALPKTRIMMLIAIFSPILFTALALSWLISRRSRKFKQSFLNAISMTLLKMKTGRSFRQSFNEVITESEPSLRAKLTEIASVVAFSQQKTLARSSDPFVVQVIEELSVVDRNSHAAAKRLAVFRDKLRIEEDFRRRSGQVMSRIRAQSSMMCALYLAVFAFVLWKFGWKSNSSILIASLMLFASGAIWIWLGGRRMKWKV